MKERRTTGKTAKSIDFIRVFITCTRQNGKLVARVMSPGALTSRLASRYQRPARQIAAWNPNLSGGALNEQSEITLHFAVVRSGHFRPAPFRFRFQNRPFSAKKSKRLTPNKRPSFTDESKGQKGCVTA
jgi:hypothetical protein